MSDELERRLRDAGHRLPTPATADTLAARARFLEAVRDRRRPFRRRTPVLALILVVAVGGAFGVGYAVAAGGGTKTKVVKERLNAGPGFLPADGWSSGVTLDPRSGAVVAATVTNTHGTRIVARFAPASTQPGLPTRLLPLRLDDAQPAGGATRRLRARVAAAAIDVRIAFGSAHPSAAALVAAREELGRLVVPACPAARPLTRSDVDAARRYVLRWLPAHYDGNAGDVVGAIATARAGNAMPRHDEAAHDCGARVASRSVEVDVVLPILARVSASLSELTYFVAKTPQGWSVWERAR
jgi:hypothetical protein